MYAWTDVGGGVGCIQSAKNPEKNVIPPERGQIRPERVSVWPDGIDNQANRHTGEHEQAQTEEILPVCKEKINKGGSDVHKP